MPDRHLPARVNQHVMIVRPDPTVCQPLFLLHAINQHNNKEALLSIARSGGATREALTKDNVGNFEITLPHRQLISTFEEFAVPWLEQSHKLAAMNVELARARDLLLPKLMNGTLTV